MTARVSPAVGEALARWYRARHGVDVEVRLDEAPAAAGHSNELVFVTLGKRAVVVRLAPEGPQLFPAYDLRMQAVAQEAAAAGGVPVAAPVVVELDERWLGRPFLLLPRVEGRHVGDAPTFCDWLTALDEAAQRALHEAFLDALVAVHRCDWAWARTALRGAETGLAEEIGWWEDLARWAFPGQAGALLELFAVCRADLPAHEPPRSLLWGDVRLGNVVFDDGGRPAAVLDWEMASIGPAESDVAWFTTLSAATEHFVGATVPGFLDRAGVVAHVEAGIGRALRDLEWHERFALARAATLSARTQALDALRRGRPAPDPASTGMVRYALSRR